MTRHVIARREINETLRRVCWPISGRSSSALLDVLLRVRLRCSLLRAPDLGSTSTSSLCLTYSATGYIFVCVLLMTWGASVVAASERNGSLISVKHMGHRGTVDVAEVTYWSKGLRVKGRLFWPGGKPFPHLAPGARPLPAVIFNHDGVQGVSRWTSIRAAALADAGYVVFAPSFRGEDGSEGIIEVAHGEVDDVLNAASMVSSFPGVDGHRMAAVGMSHGALISVLAAERSPAFRCVVEAYGVMDIFGWWAYLKSHGFRTDDAISLRIYGRGPRDRPTAFHVRNAVEGVARLKAPLLILQGNADSTVPVEQARLMEKVCRQHGKQCEVHIYEGARHGFLIYGGSESSDPPAEVHGQRAAWSEMLKFLRRYIGP